MTTARGHHQDGEHGENQAEPALHGQRGEARPVRGRSRSRPGAGPAAAGSRAWSSVMRRAFHPRWTTATSSSRPPYRAAAASSPLDQARRRTRPPASRPARGPWPAALPRRAARCPAPVRPSNSPSVNSTRLAPAGSAHLLLLPAEAGHQAQRRAAPALDQLDAAGRAEQQAGVAGPQDPHPAAVRREGQLGQRGEHVLAFPLGHQHLLEQLDHRRRGASRPGPATARPPAGTRRWPPRPGRARRRRRPSRARCRRGLDHVVEVAAEQRLRPAGPVAGHDLESAGAQQRGRQQARAPAARSPPPAAR